MNSYYGFLIPLCKIYINIKKKFCIYLRVHLSRKHTNSYLRVKKMLSRTIYVVIEEKMFGLWLMKRHIMHTYI